MVNFRFGKNRCLFNINTIAPDITDSTLHELRFSYVFNGYDVTSSFFHLSKIGWYNVCSKNYLIIGIFPSQIGLLTIEEEDVINREKFKFIDSILKGLSILHDAGVLDLSPLSHYSIKSSYFLRFYSWCRNYLINLSCCSYCFLVTFNNTWKMERSK